MITIGTDCSGIEAPIQALIQLNIPYRQKWSCEIDKYARQSCEANYKEPEVVYEDMLNRDTKNLPHVDFYICGFPCQSFSLMGKRLGTKDKRSKIIPKMLETIKISKPKVCILENVKGFINIENGIPMKKLVSNLKVLGYKVYHSLYNTKDYGLPQNRERIYFVCIRTDIQKKEYIKPDKCKMKKFESILVDKQVQPGDVPDMYKFNNIIKNGKDLHIINNNYNKLQYMKNISPTLTTTSKYYILELNRIINLRESLRLQGFSDKFSQVVSNNQLMKQIGNSMSVNVLKCIIKKVIECI